MDMNKLPPGVSRAAPGTGDHVAFGVRDGNKVTFDDPVMTGMQTQIQHPATPERPEPTEEPGLFAGTVVQTPVGPLVCIQMRHHDGTSLTAMMTLPEAREWHETWNELCQRAILLDTTPQGRG